MTPPPAVVAFDVMDTVLRDPFREALTAGTGLPLEEVLRRRDPGAWPAFERGELTEEEYFATYGDLPVDREAFHAARRAGYRWLPGMRELLLDLAGHAVRATASNYPVWIEELASTWLADCFDVFVASHHLGARKPERAFYLRLCGELDAAPEAVLFVDDREANVEAARSADLRAHRFTTADDLRGRLRTEGVPL